jgi:predicted nucleic acid-binding protein
VIVLDTNVLSEMMRPEPDSTVAAWISARPASSLFTTTVTLAEILYGVRLLPSAKRRSSLETAVSEMFATDFAGRVLPFDQAAAQAYAEIAAARRRAGRPITQFDAQIAAIARSRDAGVATRNVVDFEGCGIGVIDPWRA